MKGSILCALVGASYLAIAANAQTTAPTSIATTAATPAVPLPNGANVLPADTVIKVTPVEEITSKKMKEGDVEHLQVAEDATLNGVIFIPRGSAVTATVTWRTGKGIGGKSAKFELTFNSVNVRGVDYALKGKHRQEGKGNTVGALLGSMFISGRSAVMESGQIVNAFTAVPIPAN